jgi:hypothetical protein
MKYQERPGRLAQTATARILVSALLSASLAACGDDVVTWTEDVELHDGKVIKLERRAVQGASGFPSLAEKRKLERYPEDSEPVKRAAQRQRSLCERDCKHGADTDLTLEIESKPHGLFCR